MCECFNSPKLCLESVLFGHVVLLDDEGCCWQAVDTWDENGLENHYINFRNTPTRDKLRDFNTV